MNMLKNFLIFLAVAAMPSFASAQTASPAPAPVAQVDAAPVAAAPAQAVAVTADAPAASTAAPKSMDGSLPGYTPMKPTQGIGMPQSKEIDFQEQFSENGQYAKWINNAILLPIIFAISALVLGLLLWIMKRFRRSANPEPSKTTHNTTIEIIWTLLPVLILLGIAYPSLDLLAKQF